MSVWVTGFFSSSAFSSPTAEETIYEALVCRNTHIHTELKSVNITADLQENSQENLDFFNKNKKRKITSKKNYSFSYLKKPNINIYQKCARLALHTH